MAWEYLETEDFKIRFEIIKAFLSSVEWRELPLNIVDLNCGEKSTLYRLIKEEEWDIKYYGNDVMSKGFVGDNVKVERISDEDAVNRIEKFLDNVGVLCLLGDGAGEHTGEKIESSTSLNSFFKIIDKYEPRYIAYESISAFEKKFERMTYVHVGVNGKGYKLKYHLHLQILDASQYVGDRTFLFFEKSLDSSKG